jgi:predicted dehydrogenase
MLGKAVRQWPQGVTMNDRIRLLVVGLGNMGTAHVKSCLESQLVELAGICDSDQSMLDRCAASLSGVPGWLDYRSAMDESRPDAMLIATPHYDHPAIALAAFERGIHVLTEKPVAVHALDARRMVLAHETARTRKTDLLFAAMFQMRTMGHWRKIRQLLADGELGRLVRTTWIITDWFRTQAYYDSGNWRATWSGEGGGVLLNQCPHNLDMYCWLVGLPQRVHGHCGIGKYHDIEVEDEVTAYLEHANGMVGHFITTTGEAPGTNRLEIVGENGKLVYENDTLTFSRNRRSMLAHLKESKEGFSRPECWTINIPFERSGASPHLAIIENFARAIRRGEPLVAPASDGLAAVMLGNAILYSSLQASPIAMPMDEAAYAAKLAELASTSRFVKKAAASAAPAADFSRSFRS